METRQDEFGKVRLFGDLVLAAFFCGEQSSERERKRGDYANAIMNGEAGQYRCWLEEWRHAERSLAPFHWEIEFPEVFDRENPGFDSIVGNPPFAGVVTLATSSGETYTEYLRRATVMSGGKCDLVAFFFRKAWFLIRASGSFGFVATKTIAEGDTRRSGLARILEEGGVIYDVWRASPSWRQASTRNAPEPIAGSQTLRSRICAGWGGWPSAPRSRARIGARVVRTIGSVRARGV
jgi:hypothetical protein